MPLTIDEMLDHALEHARTVLVGQPGAEMIPTWLIQAKDQSTVVGTPWRNDQEKELCIFALRQMLKRDKAESYSFISEAWCASEDVKHPIGLQPRDREDRKEVVIMNAFDRQGGKMRIYDIQRDGKGVVSDIVAGPDTHLDRFEGRLYNLFKDEDSHAG